MRANLSSKLLALAAMTVGLGLAYCGGTVETDPTGEATQPGSVTPNAATPIEHAVNPPSVPTTAPSYRVPQPAAVPEAPPPPDEPPCPGCPPPPGIAPIDFGSPIDRPS